MGRGAQHCPARLFFAFAIDRLLAHVWLKLRSLSAYDAGCTDDIREERRVASRATRTEPSAEVSKVKGQDLASTHNPELVQAAKHLAGVDAGDRQLL